MSKEDEEKVIKEIEESITQEPPESKGSIIDCLDCNRQSPQRYYVTPSVYQEWLGALSQKCRNES